MGNNNGENGTETIIGPGGEVEEVEADEVKERAEEMGDSGEVIEEGQIEETSAAVEEGPDVDDLAERLQDARNARQNLAERLDQLERDLEDVPLFAAERDEHAEAFDLPGGRGWILPRTIAPEEEREYDEIVGGTPRVRMKGEGQIDTIETDVKVRERYEFLVNHAIEECELLRANGHKVCLSRDKPKQRREMRNILLHQIHPRFAEYIELRLLDYNGLTAAQRGARDFT